MENFCAVGDTRNAIDTMTRRPAPPHLVVIRVGTALEYWHITGPSTSLGPMITRDPKRMHRVW